ncbi:MAG: hypothetical protein HZB29_02630 [Nitrospinae bacterium]|nr:hypothetical protein [Nitrospinota bacterium]
MKFTFGERLRGKSKGEGRGIVFADMAPYVAPAMLCLAATLIYVYPSIRATSLMYEYSARLRTFGELREMNKKLKLELSSVRSYDFVESRAISDLGFVFPGPGQVVIVAKK